jgi:predicted metal-dependent hydrolase
LHEPPAARCGEPPSPGLIHALTQFNRREFFECHETLEAIWNAEPGPIRVLYKGILQVGVGCYHLLRRNYRGAIIKLQSGAGYLEPFAPQCMGVEVERLIADARRLRAALVALGPEHFLEVDLDLVPMVHLLRLDSGETEDQAGDEAEDEA